MDGAPPPPPDPEIRRHHDTRPEVAGAEPCVDGVSGLEGPARMLADVDARWADPRQRADMIRLAEQLEAEPSLLGMNPRLLAVARRPA